MHIDFKISTWERVDIIDDSIKDELIERIKNGDITSSSDMFDFFNDDQFEFDSDIMFETSEQLSPQENGGNSTIEVFGDDEEDIWNNETKKPNKK